jgi:D-psicose/D-tagatose/L-ribulose 3-epimerase
MKFGCCVNMLSKAAVKIGYEFIPLVEKLGFDYVELPLAQVMELDEEAFAAGPLAAVQAANIPCLRMNNFLPSTLRLTGSDARLDEALDYARKALKRASRLGVMVVVMGSSGARNRPLHVSLAQGEAQLVAFLKALAPIAEENGIVIAIEHLNKLESNIVNSYADSCTLARRVNNSAVGTLLDIFHMDMVGESIDNLRNTGSLLKHVHVARTLNRSFPKEGDESDYMQLFAMFKDIGYDDTISFEAYVQGDFAMEATEALRYLKSQM